MAVLLHYLLTLPVLGGLAEGGDGTVCPSETSLGQIRDRLSLCGGGVGGNRKYLQLNLN